MEMLRRLKEQGPGREQEREQERAGGGTHGAELGAGPAGGWHRGNSLMPQRALCGGTGRGRDLCSASGWVTGVLWSLQEPG